MNSNEQLKIALIRSYGTQCESDIETILRKLEAVIAGHLFAGKLGNTPLAKLNRIFDEIFK